MEEKKEHFEYIKRALSLAKEAFERDEVPVGALVVHKGRVIAKAYNLCEQLNDPTAHAEMQVITAACHHLNSKRLSECSVYISLEPCPMCAEALYLSRPEKVIYSAPDLKRGFKSVFNTQLHPSTALVNGILQAESSELLKNFFKSKRN